MFLQVYSSNSLLYFHYN
ncbi:hypothetical protein OIU84_011315, partial [Salix udensis]